MAKRNKGGSSPLKIEEYKHRPLKLEAKRKRRKEKWNSDRIHWKNDEEYQKRQKERQIKLDAYKPGMKFHLKAENEAEVNKKNEQKNKRSKFKRRR